MKETKLMSVTFGLLERGEGGLSTGGRGLYTSEYQGGDYARGGRGRGEKLMLTVMEDERTEGCAQHFNCEKNYR